MLFYFCFAEFAIIHTFLAVDILPVSFTFNLFMMFIGIMIAIIVYYQIQKKAKIAVENKAFIDIAVKFAQSNLLITIGIFVFCLFF